MNFSKIQGMVGKDKEGVAYIVHKTIKAITAGSHPDKAFQDAAEDENYHGDRVDIVSDRKLAIDTLHKLGHKVNDFPKSEKAAPLDHWTTNYKFKKESMNLINRANKLLEATQSDSLPNIMSIWSKFGWTKDKDKYTHPSGKLIRHKAGSNSVELHDGDYPTIIPIHKLGYHLAKLHQYEIQSESLDLNEAHSHEDIANNPPKFVPLHHHDVWKALVLRDKHTNYGSAVNHYKRHMFKHGTVGATKMAKVSLGQSMTAESKSLISRAKGLLGITELDDNPLDSEVSDSSDKLNHSGKKTTMGLIKPIVRKYRAFGGVNHSVLKNDAKSHSTSSRLSSK